MKKKYTKKQILESIKYWKKQLHKMNENISRGTPYEYKTIAEGLEDLWYHIESSVDNKDIGPFEEYYNYLCDAMFPDEKNKHVSAIEALDELSFYAQTDDDADSVWEIVDSVDGIRELIGKMD